jgi:hypothetical protein
MMPDVLLPCVAVLQVQGSAVDVRRFVTGCALSRQDLALSDEQAIEFIFRIHAGSNGEVGPMCNAPWRGML